MGKKDSKKIPDSVTSIGLGKVGVLTDIEQSFHGFKTKRDETPDVSLKYYDEKFQCFSDWDVDDLKSFSSFVKNISQSNWTQIFKSGGKSGEKTGFGMTYHKDRSKLPNHSKLSLISEEIPFFELRVTQKARVHGFRSVSTFFLVWLDKDHAVYKE